MSPADLPIPVSDLGTTLRTMREAAGLTQLDFARIADIDQGYLSRIEAGLRTPSKRFAAHLTRVLAEIAESA